MPTETTRPTGSNADEWHLFLCEYLDNRAIRYDGLGFIAVQVAEAIEDALKPSRRSVALTNSNSELFDAASVILEWLRALPVADRPIAKFNRLLDAINGVREAHQMGESDV